jgi:hypothetical protein
MSTLIKRPDNMVWDDRAGKWITLGVKHEVDFAHVVNNFHFHSLAFAQERDIVERQRRRTPPQSNKERYLILLSLTLWVPRTWRIEVAEVLTLQFQGLPPMFEPSEFRRLGIEAPPGFTAFDFGDNTSGAETREGKATVETSFVAYPEDGLVADKESNGLVDFEIQLSERRKVRDLIVDRRALIGERSWAIAYPIPRPKVNEEEVAARAEEAWIDHLKKEGGMATV